MNHTGLSVVIQFWRSNCFRSTGREKAAQSTLAAQVAVAVEIGQCQLAQSAMDRLAPAQSGVVRFRDGTPAPVLAENGDHVVGIVFRFHVE